jgi:hypothetical protein
MSSYVILLKLERVPKKVAFLTRFCGKIHDFRFYLTLAPCIETKTSLIRKLNRYLFLFIFESLSC